MATRHSPKVVMAAPTRTESSAHPRRQPANRSVSLLHSPRRPKPKSNGRSDSSSDGNLADRTRPAVRKFVDSPSSLQPLGRDSSGESSNAEKWFEKSNNEVRDQSASFADDDPPFFMRNSSSSQTPPDNPNAPLKYFPGANDGVSSLPLHTGLLRLGTDGSSTEDFRSVIDDLTIENKKLKRKLKKYEKLHDSHLKDEKLFEVRIHGLTPHKKRELEDMLRKFASGLASRGTTGFPPNGYEGLMPLLNPHKTTSSQTSLQNADSAYASMSASGQGSSAQSGHDGRRVTPGLSAVARRHSLQTSVKSYLHHIPEGLLAQPNPANMTERAKKKLVVKRLEQIFAGKGAAVGGHQQPLQQQEVSQIAARADRSAMEAQGQRAGGEGSREALIMLQEKDETQDPTIAEGERQAVSPEPAANASLPRLTVSQQDIVEPSAHRTTLDQRPTRPLDLDPYRAQVPEENIRYIRHLGFSPPDPDSQITPEEGHGWIYLNLLVNMAQLHTINVTADFVRKAVSEHSHKFELSQDGRKVRWKGGGSVTRTSSTGGGSSNDRTGDATPDDQSPRKRPKLSHRETVRSGLGLRNSGRTGAWSRNQLENKLTYTPLFFHKDSTDEADESSSADEDDSLSSPFLAPVGGDSSGVTSSGIRTTMTMKHKNKDDGPIIFYNNARFCTDLSGERKPDGNPNAPPYTKASVQPLGQPLKTSSLPTETRGPLAGAGSLPEPMDLADNPIPESMELTFPPRSPLKPGSPPERKAIDFQVTGIGGVWPADHFAINVQSQHMRVEQDAEIEAPGPTLPQALPAKFAQILHGERSKSKPRAVVCEQVISAKRQELAPSKLPPALSFMPFSEEALEDDESDVDYEISVPPESPGAFPPSAAPQAIDVPMCDTDDEGEDEDEDDGSDSGSLDLLAAAREIDPEAVRAREREYDAHMADRLAEEIPAGSSAATAGGGSGFASPASDGDGGERRRAVRARSGFLKRVETSDSMVVLEETEGEESEEVDDDDDDDEEEDDYESDGIDDAAS